MLYYHEIAVKFLVGKIDFLIFQRVQTGSEDHPTSLSQGIKLITHIQLLPRVKLAGRYNSTPQYTLMVWCLIKQRHNFTLKCIKNNLVNGRKSHIWSQN